MLLVIGCVLSGAGTASAASAPAVAALAGHVPLEARRLIPIGRAEGSRQIPIQVTLALRNRAELTQLLQEIQDPASPQYHHWLTASEFDTRFGPTQHDLDAVRQWVTSQGFKITDASLSDRYVSFTASVIQAEKTFGTTIMAFGDGSSYSNITDPQVPAQLVGVIESISGLNNFLHSIPANGGKPRMRVAVAPPGSESSAPSLTEPLMLASLEHSPPMAEHLRSSNRRSRGPGSQGDTFISPFLAFGPIDLYTFYDYTPRFNAGNTGGSGCIAIVGDSGVLASGPTTFATDFTLPKPSITTVLVNGTSPGANGDEDEAQLDLQWSHASAPGAAQVFYLGNGSKSSTNGPIVDAIQRAVNDNLCQVISVSFGFCGVPNSFFTGTLTPIYAKAATQGQSIFISSGDQGAAGIVFDAVQKKCVPATTAHVNELGADPNVTSVGGTSILDPNYDSNSVNVGHVAEDVWNDEFFLGSGGATGGGVSAIYSKPSYQSGTGVPADGKRDVPDISMVASNVFPGVFWVTDNGGTAELNCCIGGTSLAAPIWAGIAKLIGQLQGGTGRLGNINPKIYQLARAGLAVNGFRDVNDGVDNGFNGVTGFVAGTGFDLSTGWGTVDVDIFARKFAAAVSPTPTATPKGTPTRTPTPKPTPTHTPTTKPTPTHMPTTKPTATPTPNPIAPKLQLRSFTLNLGVPAVPGCVNSPAQAVTGAALGDTCAASMSVNMQAGQLLWCFVNAANQVTFRLCQFNGTGLDPDGVTGATYKALLAH